MHTLTLIRTALHRTALWMRHCSALCVIALLTLALTTNLTMSCYAAARSTSKLKARTVESHCAPLLQLE